MQGGEKCVEMQLTWQVPCIEIFEKGQKTPRITLGGAWQILRSPHHTLTLAVATPRADPRDDQLRDTQCDRTAVE